MNKGIGSLSGNGAALGAGEIEAPSSLPSLSDLRYVGSVWLLYGLVIAAAILARHAAYSPDYGLYVAMASHAGAHVTQPYADRVLGPWLASLLTPLTGLSPAAALGTVCTFFWAMAGLPIALILKRTHVPLGWASVVALIPFPFVDARYYLVPDGVAVFFTSVFLLLWEERKYASSTPAVIASILARNTGALGIGLWPFAESKKQLIAFPVLGILGGLLLHRIFFFHDATNIHGVSPVLYLPAKVASDLLGNLFGFHPYVNTHPLCASPIFTLALPHLSAMGRVTTIGACPFDGGAIVTSLLCYAVIFGLFPLLVFLLLRSGAAAGMKLRASVFMLLYAIAPGLGLTIPRLFVEAFPFLIPLIGPAIAQLPEASRENWLKWARLYGAASFTVIILMHYL